MIVHRTARDYADSVHLHRICQGWRLAKRCLLGDSGPGLVPSAGVDILGTAFYLQVEQRLQCCAVSGRRRC